MSDADKVLTVAFYQTPAGRAPVREWLLKELSPANRLIIGEDLKTVEFGWPVGMPTCRPMKNGLWEVRSNLSDGRQIARVLFCVAEGHMVLLHGFIKKTEQTSDKDIDLALQRMREVMS